MGEAKRKKERKAAIIAAHPTCIFCNQRPATTLDHIPSRQCFYGRQAPVGYEFPACKKCNHATSTYEQVAAFYMKIWTESQLEESESTFHKAIRSISNNHPAALPDITLTANQKRRAIKNFNNLPEPIHSFSDAPIARIPNEAKRIIELFNRKICCALYFKELSKPLPKNHFIATTAFPLGHKNADMMLNFANRNFENLVTTSRPNVELGNQFIYRFGKSRDEEIFAYTAQFHFSFILTGFVAPYNNSGAEWWVPHHRDIDSDWRWKLDDTDSE